MTDKKKSVECPLSDKESVLIDELHRSGGPG